MDKKGVTEEQHYAQGWRRWYELHDHPYRVVFGHTVFQHGPLIYKPGPGIGECIGIDTGAHFCGQLTAIILPDLKIIQTPITRPFTR